MQQRFSILAVGSFIFLLLIINEYCPGFFHREVIYAYTTLCIAVALLFQVLYRKRNDWNISLFDVAIGLLVLYGVGRSLICDNEFVDGVVLYKWLAVLLGYIWIRNFSQKEIILYALVLSGVEEAVTCISQYMGWVGSYHSFFEITGHLGNPGPLGGYLAVCLTVAVHLLKKALKEKKNKLRIGLLASIILLAIGIILSNSRAAWLGTIIGCLFLIPAISLRSLLKTKRIVLFIGLLILLGALLYSYRPKSANARLLIWTVSADMVSDKPFTGHGWCSFQKKYMLYQAKYLKEKGSEEERLIADNVTYTYNEWLHLTVETGFIGLLFALFIVVNIYRVKSVNNFNLTIQAASAAWLTFSIFSYPTDIFPLLMLFPFLLGCIQSEKHFIFFKNYVVKIPVFFLLLCISMGSLWEGMFYLRASKEIADVFKTDNVSGKLFAQKNYPKLKNNITFNMTYLQNLVRHSSDLHDDNIVDKIIPNTETYIWLGNYYHRTGKYQKAEQAYLLASDMVPNRMMANYKLWRMYLELGNEKKSIEIAKWILSQPVKVINSFTINARTEIKTFLSDK